MILNAVTKSQLVGNLYNNNHKKIMGYLLITEKILQLSAMEFRLSSV